MITSIAAICAFFGIIGLGAGTGYFPIRKMIQMSEARHELKHGSASFLRRLSGWIFIAIWMACIWYFATITGDWWATGDLGGAIARSMRRLELVLRILAALADD